MKEAPTRHFGVGYEHNLNRRLSLLLQYTADFNTGMSSEGDFNYSGNGGYYRVSYYARSENSMSVEYEAKYFFSDNEYGACYMSSGIAWQKFKMVQYASERNENSGENTNYCDISGSRTLIPISFRLGYRSPLDRLFIDFNAGFSFTPGVSDFGCDLVDDHIDAPVFNTFSFNFNIAVGYGWGD
jgi:hypothetical protein